MPAGFFVDENDLALGKALGQERGNVVHPGHPGLPEVPEPGLRSWLILMGMRRFTRLTDAFSKEVESHAHAVSLRFMHYNFARHHKTVTKPYGHPTTPALAAGWRRLRGRLPDPPSCWTSAP